MGNTLTAAEVNRRYAEFIQEHPFPSWEPLGIMYLNITDQQERFKALFKTRQKILSGVIYTELSSYHRDVLTDKITLTMEEIVDKMIADDVYLEFKYGERMINTNYEGFIIDPLTKEKKFLFYWYNDGHLKNHGIYVDNDPDEALVIFIVMQRQMRMGRNPYLRDDVLPTLSRDTKEIITDVGEAIGKTYQYSIVAGVLVLAGYFLVTQNK
jgi:hypothetical protein